MQRSSKAKYFTATIIAVMGSATMASATETQDPLAPPFSRRPSKEFIQLPEPQNKPASVKPASPVVKAKRITRRPMVAAKPEVAPVAAPVPAPAPSIDQQEVAHLLVPNQKYLLKFEDEETYGRASMPGNSATVTFTQQEAESFKNAIAAISSYRDQMRTSCSGGSAKLFSNSLERYLWSLASFNRKGLPLVADISQNNNLLVLVVNRTSLIDAPVLTSRYLQFKRQRFKESMDTFLPADNELVSNMVTVANILRVELTDQDWNKSYGVRENALEALSLWPRETIFEATAKLTEVKEGACVVKSTSQTNLASDKSTEAPPAVAPAD